MSKAKSSKDKDDKKNIKALKNKSDKQNKNAKKSLKSIQTKQQQTTAPDKKSLNSLKNIQQQLNKLVTQREAEKKHLEALKQKTSRLNQKTSALSQQNIQLDQRVEGAESQLKQNKSQLEDNETQLEKNQFQIKKNKSQLKKSTANLEKSLSLTALNSDLLRIKYSLEKKNERLSQDTKKLANEIAHFKELNQRVEEKIHALENEPVPASEGLQALNKNHDILLLKITDFEEELKEYSDTFINSEQNNEAFSEQLKQLNIAISQLNENQQNHDTQIKLLQTDTSNIRKSLQQETQNFQQQSIHHQEDIDAIKHTITQLEDNFDQQEQSKENLASTEDTLAPLESQESLQAQFQEKISKQLDERLAEQLDEKLLKPQEIFTQQLQESSNQSINLENLISEIQIQQNTDQAHHDELSKQYLLQQQQLDKHDSQLSQLDPLIAQNEITEQQLAQISTSLEHFSNTQNNLTALENELQSGFLTLEQKIEANQTQEQNNIQQVASQQQNIERYQQELDARQENLEKHHQSLGHQQGNLEQHQQELENRQEDIKSHQLHIENHQQKMVSYQQDQGVEINQLSEQVKSRSKWFAIALVSTFTLSTLLFLNRELITQELGLSTDEVSNSNKEEFISKIKTAITNETYTKINALTKQNSGIINEQLNQVRDSIDSLRKQTELLSTTKANTSPIGVTETPQALQKLQQNWEQQHQTLQDDLRKTQSQQQTLVDGVDKLSDEVKDVKQQLIESAKLQATKSIPLKTNAITDQTESVTIEVIKLEKNAQSFYTVQLLGAMKKESIKDFIQQHKLSNTSRIYQVEWQNKPWYILVQGHFSSFSKAKASLKTLPEFLSKNQPWIKKLP